MLERSSPRARMHVLLADDAHDERDMYALYLKHLGVSVETAADGCAALEAICERRPDAVVLDLAMPGITGWQVIRKVRGNPGTRTIPIVVVSGRRAQAAALEAGADGYLEKPCAADILFTELMRVLRTRGASRSTT